jgi:hypothetical protein
MKAGMPYRARESWGYSKTAKTTTWNPDSKHYGAHDLAPIGATDKNPFFLWEKILGKSSKGLTLNDDLTNLDQVLKEIMRREKIK